MGKVETVVWTNPGSWSHASTHSLTHSWTSLFVGVVLLCGPAKICLIVQIFMYLTTCNLTTFSNTFFLLLLLMHSFLFPVMAVQTMWCSPFALAILLSINTGLTLQFYTARQATWILPLLPMACLETKKLPHCFYDSCLVPFHWLFFSPPPVLSHSSDQL